MPSIILQVATVAIIVTVSLLLQSQKVAGLKVGEIVYVDMESPLLASNQNTSSATLIGYDRSTGLTNNIAFRIGPTSLLGNFSLAQISFQAKYICYLPNGDFVVHSNYMFTLVSGVTGQRLSSYTDYDSYYFNTQVTYFLCSTTTNTFYFAGMSTSKFNPKSGSSSTFNGNRPFLVSATFGTGPSYAFKENWSTVFQALSGISTFGLIIHQSPHDDILAVQFNMNSVNYLYVLSGSGTLASANGNTVSSPIADLSFSPSKDIYYVSSGTIFKLPVSNYQSATSVTPAVTSIAKSQFVTGSTVAESFVHCIKNPNNGNDEFVVLSVIGGTGQGDQLLIERQTVFGTSLETLIVNQVTGLVSSVYQRSSNLIFLLTQAPSTQLDFPASLFDVLSVMAIDVYQTGQHQPQVDKIKNPSSSTPVSNSIIDFSAPVLDVNVLQQTNHFMFIRESDGLAFLAYQTSGASSPFIMLRSVSLTGQSVTSRFNFTQSMTITGIAVDNNTGLFVYGFYSSTNIAILKYNSDGSLAWSRVFTDNLGIRLQAGVYDPSGPGDGTLYVAGWLSRLNSVDIQSVSSTNLKYVYLLAVNNASITMFKSVGTINTPTVNSISMTKTNLIALQWSETPTTSVDYHCQLYFNGAYYGSVPRQCKFALHNGQLLNYEESKYSLAISNPPYYQDRKTLGPLSKTYDFSSSTWRYTYMFTVDQSTGTAMTIISDYYSSTTAFTVEIQSPTSPMKADTISARSFSPKVLGFDDTRGHWWIYGTFYGGSLGLDRSFQSQTVGIFLKLTVARPSALSYNLVLPTFAPPTGNFTILTVSPTRMFIDYLPQSSTLYLFKDGIYRALYSNLNSLVGVTAEALSSFVGTVLSNTQIDAIYCPFVRDGNCYFRRYQSASISSNNYWASTQAVRRYESMHYNPNTRLTYFACEVNQNSYVGYYAYYSSYSTVLIWLQQRDTYASTFISYSSSSSATTMTLKSFFVAPSGYMFFQIQSSDSNALFTRIIDTKSAPQLSSRQFPLMFGMDEMNYLYRISTTDNLIYKHLYNDAVGSPVEIGWTPRALGLSSTIQVAKIFVDPVDGGYLKIGTYPGGMIVEKTVAGSGVFFEKIEGFSLSLIQAKYDALNGYLMATIEVDGQSFGDPLSTTQSTAVVFKIRSAVSSLQNSTDSRSIAELFPTGIQPLQTIFSGNIPSSFTNMDVLISPDFQISRLILQSNYYFMTNNTEFLRISLTQNVQSFTSLSYDPGNGDIYTYSRNNGIGRYFANMTAIASYSFTSFSSAAWNKANDALVLIGIGSSSMSVYTDDLPSRTNLFGCVFYSLVYRGGSRQPIVDLPVTCVNPAFFQFYDLSSSGVYVTVIVPNQAFPDVFGAVVLDSSSFKLLYHYMNIPLRPMGITPTARLIVTSDTNYDKNTQFGLYNQKMTRVSMIGALWSSQAFNKAGCDSITLSQIILDPYDNSYLKIGYCEFYVIVEQVNQQNGFMQLLWLYGNSIVPSRSRYDALNGTLWIIGNFYGEAFGLNTGQSSQSGYYSALQIRSSVSSIPAPPLTVPDLFKPQAVGDNMELFQIVPVSLITSNYPVRMSVTEADESLIYTWSYDYYVYRVTPSAFYESSFYYQSDTNWAINVNASATLAILRHSTSQGCINVEFANLLYPNDYLRSYNPYSLKLNLQLGLCDTLNSVAKDVIWVGSKFYVFGISTGGGGSATQGFPFAQNSIGRRLFLMQLDQFGNRTLIMNRPVNGSFANVQRLLKVDNDRLALLWSNDSSTSLVEIFNLPQLSVISSALYPKSTLVAGVTVNGLYSVDYVNSSISRMPLTLGSPFAFDQPLFSGELAKEFGEDVQLGYIDFIVDPTDGGLIKIGFLPNSIVIEKVAADGSPFCIRSIAAPNVQYRGASFSGKTGIMWVLISTTGPIFKKPFSTQQSFAIAVYLFKQVFPTANAQSTGAANAVTISLSVIGALLAVGIIAAVIVITRKQQAAKEAGRIKSVPAPALPAKTAEASEAALNSTSARSEPVL